ncbi:hypothetical protein B1NLA3E_19095 [Bacillus sp. 1NLA3E]|nr:hypothetical protein B1NLA3E_19095 [Bacillus sp. 1NLA3E]
MKLGLDSIFHRHFDLIFTFKNKALIMLNVDWSGRRETPAGVAGQVRPRKSFSDEEAHRPPRGKRSAWNGNQHSMLTEPKTKKTMNVEMIPFQTLQGLQWSDRTFIIPICFI